MYTTQFFLLLNFELYVIQILVAIKSYIFNCTSLQVWRVVRLTSLPYSPWRREEQARVVSVSPSKALPRPRCHARITATVAAPWSTCRPSREITRSRSSSPRRTSQVWCNFIRQRLLYNHCHVKCKVIT